MHVKCSCGARLKVTDSMRGRKSQCPRCSRVFRIAPAEPEPVPQVDPEEGYDVAGLPETPDVADPVWVPHEREAASSKRVASPGRKRMFVTLLAILVPVLAGVALVVVPPLLPKEDRADVVRKYLNALQEGRLDEADLLAVFDDHLRIDAHDQVFVDNQSEQHLSGRFDGLSRLHRRMDEDYDWHSHRARFFKSDRVGTGLEVLDQLTDAKKMLDESGAYDKLYQIGEIGQRGDEGFDALLQIYGAVGSLATEGGPVSRDTLSPGYEELRNRLGPDLTPEEATLAQRFALEPKKWDKLLGRDFVSLKGGGNFDLEEATVTTRAYGEVSPGEGGRVLNLNLIRFRLGQIDTGWKIWSVTGEQTPPPTPRSYSEGYSEPSS